MQWIVNIEESAIDFLFQWSAAAVKLSAVKMYRYQSEERTIIERENCKRKDSV